MVVRSCSWASPFRCHWFPARGPAVVLGLPLHLDRDAARTPRVLMHLPHDTLLASPRAVERKRPPFPPGATSGRLGVGSATAAALAPLVSSLASSSRRRCAASSTRSQCKESLSATEPLAIAWNRGFKLRLDTQLRLHDLGVDHRRRWRRVGAGDRHQILTSP